MVERNEIVTEATTTERTEIERIRIQVLKAQADVVPSSEATYISTPLLNPTMATAFQDHPATPSTAKTLLLLTTSPRFDRTATKTSSKFAKSSARQEKLPSKESSIAYVFPNATEVHIDLTLANQHTTMAYQYALDRRMDKMESLMLQILKVLQKGN